MNRRMTPNEELMERFRVLCELMDTARAQFMARKAETERRYLAAIEENSKEEPK